MFLACRVPKLAFRKVPKTSLFTVFCTPTEDKTTLCAMFSYSQYPKMKPKQWYLRCFCNREKGVFGECRKTKSNIRMAKIQKRCILRCFFAFRCENFCFEKRSKHRNLQCFSAPTKYKTTLFTMFSFSRNPKIEPKHRYLRCFCNTKKSQRSQNTAICVTFTTPHMQNAVFYSVFEPPLQKHWYLRCFEKLLA